MVSSLSYNDDECIESYISTSQALEVAYQQSLNGVELIVRDEGNRRLRLRILMLENENDDLHQQLALGDDGIDVLERDCKALHGQVAQAHEELLQLNMVLGTQARELSGLKVELGAMNSITTDSTRLLTENLSLSRELSTLKPEVDHLRSQALHQQIVLTEKLALQRQLNTLEIELEAERHATRGAVKSVCSDKETELQRVIEILEKDLTREKQEKEKLGMAHKDVEHKLLTRVEELQNELFKEKQGQKLVRRDSEVELQDRLDNLQKTMVREKKTCEQLRRELDDDRKTSEILLATRAKLASTKDQLKNCKEELSQARKKVVGEKGPGTRKGLSRKDSLKRGVDEMDHEVAISTPDGAGNRGKRPRNKRGVVDQILLGEKSMFSITPYLNRQSNTVLEAIAPDEDVENNAAPSQKRDQSLRSENPPARQPCNRSPVHTFKRAQAEAQSQTVEKLSAQPTSILTDIAGTRGNNSPPAKRSKLLPITLENVAEGEEKENDFNEAQPNASIESLEEQQLRAKETNFKPQNIPSETTEPIRRKRKVLGASKTIFEEEDAETNKRPTKIALGAGRLLGKASLGGGSKRTNGIGFASFSPLKKDKRGVGASFLS